MKEFDSDRDALMWLTGLIEGEGSLFVAQRGLGGFKLTMTDLDVIEHARSVLSSWGVELNMRSPQPSLRRDGTPTEKLQWTIATSRASYLKIIIDKCYPYYSEKKQSDCDRVLKNLADRGLL